MGVQYIDLGYNATGTVQTIRVGKDISLFAQGGEPPVPVVDPPTIALSTSSISATDTFVLATIVSEVAWELTGTGISTITGESSDIVTITVGENTGSTSREFTFIVTNSAGSDTASLTQAAPEPVVTRDIHATYNFVANTPTKIYDEYGVTAVTDATYTIDDGTETYTGNTLEFATDGAHTLHFVSEDHHTWTRMFSGCTQLTSVVFDGSVHELYANTCRACSPGLTAVTMTGVTVIGTSAFEGCGHLNILDGSPQYNNKLHEGLVEIGNKAFSNTSLSGTLTIPKTVTTIGASAFTQQYNCMTLNFETGRTEVCTFGNYAFNSCFSLRTLNLAPELDLSSGTNIFRNCTGLTAVTGYSVPTNHPHETNTRAIRGGCFQGCKNLVSFNAGEGFAQVNVPEGIEKIGPSAFSGCTAITSVDLPSTLVNNVGYSAALDVKAPFAASGVNKIISRSTTEPPVSSTSFTGMSATGVLYTPAGADYTNWLTYLGTGWTQDSMGNLPGDVEITYVGDSMPMNILSSTGVSIIDSMSVDGVIYEPTQYFTFTGSGRTVRYYGVNENRNASYFPGNVVSIVTNQALGGFNNNETITAVTVNAPGKTIGGFAGCTSLVELNLVTLKEFYANAFQNCTSLTSVTIPEGCTTVRLNSFAGCTGLTSLYIPSTLGITYQTSSSFSGLTSLTSLTVNKMQAPTAGYFSGAASGTLYVPQGATGYEDWLAVLGEGWSLSYITP